MNEKKRELPPNLSRDGEMQALRRAQQDARDIAVRTGTPLVIYHNGKIEKRFLDGAEVLAIEKTEPAAKADS
jgi:diaminopimelate decarboxylase